MEDRFVVEGNRLACHLAVPDHLHPRAQPGIVIAHGFPAEVGGGINSTASFPELADRFAAVSGWAAFTYSSRGVAESEGNFSLGGWLRDLRAAVVQLRERVPCHGVWVLGFGTGAALAVQAGADDPSITGVAAVAGPADFVDWARNPRKLLVVAREIGVVRDPEFPASFDAWAAELRRIKAVEAAARLAPRELLVVHGSDDETVPSFDARAVADAHGSADLRIIAGGGHHLRHDPRAVAVLLGWLDRQRAGLLSPPLATGDGA